MDNKDQLLLSLLRRDVPSMTPIASTKPLLAFEFDIKYGAYSCADFYPPLLRLARLKIC